VYGNGHGQSEEALPVPDSPYGTSKLNAEHLVLQWAGEGASRRAVIVRPTVVFGPGNRANIFRLIQYVCDGKFLWVGKGDAVKSIAYVENLVEATTFLLDRMGIGVEIYNYVDEPQLSTRDLVNLISRKAGVPPPRISIPLGLAIPAAGVLDVVGTILGRSFAVSAHRIRKFNTSTQYCGEKLFARGFNPPYTIEQGIERNVQWYRQLVQSAARSVHASFEE
jgi:nucleoside-diphosphate-sugar epimerase